MPINFGELDFNSMNETDVREVIVRPLLHDLGYRHGTEATILTEKPLRYDGAFLGRKKPKTDPKLRGRADYICEVTSYGRWVIEVKAPHLPLTLEDAEQAHSYAVHPGIHALFLMVTNGRRFRLYRSSELDEPIFDWSCAEIFDRLLTLGNIVGPDAIKKHFAVAKVDLGKPLARGLPSRLELVGGTVHYVEHRSDNPNVPASGITDGTRAHVTGRSVSRTPEGLIDVNLVLKGPMEVWDTLNSLFGVDHYEFSTADEFLSYDPEQPNIFQNFLKLRMPRGTIVPAIPGHIPFPMAMPFDINVEAYTEAIGFIENDRFRGVFFIDYDFRPDLRGAVIPQIPAKIGLNAHGNFEIVTR